MVTTAGVVFFHILGMILYTGVVAGFAACCGDSYGHKASDREVARRVLISDKLDDEVKVEILSIITDDIYWKYYEEEDDDGA